METLPVDKGILDIPEHEIEALAQRLHMHLNLTR